MSLALAATLLLAAAPGAAPVARPVEWPIPPEKPAPSPPEPGPAAAPAPRPEVRALVEGLGDDDWERREEAARRLRDRFLEAISPLLEASRDAPDPEVKARAGGILDDAGVPRDLLERAAADAAALASGDPAARRAAAERIEKMGLPAYPLLARGAGASAEAKEALDRLVARSLSLSQEAQDPSTGVSYRMAAQDPQIRKRRNRNPATPPFMMIQAFRGGPGIWARAVQDGLGIAAQDGMLAIVGKATVELVEMPGGRVRWNAQGFLEPGEAPSGVAFVGGWLFLRTSRGRLLRFDLRTGERADGGSPVASREGPEPPAPAPSE